MNLIQIVDKTGRLLGIVSLEDLGVNLPEPKQGAPVFLPFFRSTSSMVRALQRQEMPLPITDLRFRWVVAKHMVQAFDEPLKQAGVLYYLIALDEIPLELWSTKGFSYLRHNFED